MGGAERTSRGNAQRRHRRRRQHEPSAALTHLHEELPLLHQGLASLAALLDHPAARHTRKNTKQRKTHDRHKCRLGLVLLLLLLQLRKKKKKTCVFSKDELNVAQRRLPDVFRRLLHVLESVSHLPAALRPTENGSLKAAIKLAGWKLVGWFHTFG